MLLSSKYPTIMLHNLFLIELLSSLVLETCKIILPVCDRCNKSLMLGIVSNINISFEQKAFCLYNIPPSSLIIELLVPCIVFSKFCSLVLLTFLFCRISNK